ncbi:MAG TPA: type 4a pilus biogenesis protein PilO [Actinomycetota bacterium]|nr:type 4a pilus biogenesis protein PilO [Actinomycetota bacterium]
MNRRGPIVAGAAVAVLALLAVLLLLLPKMREVGEAREQLAAAQDQEQSLQNQLRALQEAREEAPRVRDAIRRLDTQVPPTADLPGMIRLLAGAADRAAVDFFSVAPGTPTAAEAGFSVVPAQIQVTGGYFSLDEFLYRLETLPRAVKVTSLQISPGGGEGQAAPAGLSMQLSVEFYTTDVSAGPGSVPGPTEGAAAAATVPAGG